MLAHVPTETNWVGILGVIGIFFGVLGLVGAAIAVLRSSIASNTITLLKANNEALHDQNEIQQQEINDLKTQLSTASSQISMLKEMVLSAERLDDISHNLAINRKEIADAREAIVRAIRERS